MPSKSKNKGKSWERDVANFLTDLYQESFVRVPNSGAYVGGANAVRTQTLSESQTRAFKGDIIPGPSFPYLVIEAKNYGDFPFHKLAFNQRIAKLDEWIQQSKDCCQPGDIWLLCVKITHKASFVLWDSNIITMPESFIYGGWPLEDNAEEYTPEYSVMEYNQFWEENATLVKEYQAQKKIAM
jgi:hypothetical protein